MKREEVKRVKGLGDDNRTERVHSRGKNKTKRDEVKESERLGR